MKTQIQKDARLYCLRHGIDDVEGYQRVLASMTHREFMDRIQALIEAKSRVLMFKLPRYLVHADGRVEALPIDYTPEETKFLAQVDELIAGVARELGLYSSTHPTTVIPAHTSHSSG